MGIGYAFRNLVSGNFDNAFNGLFVSDDLLAAQDKAGDNLDKIIARQQADGLVSLQEANDLYASMSPNTNSDAYWQTAGTTPLQEFTASLEESASSIGQIGSKAINKTLGLGFRLIPWQVYVLALVLAMIWLYPIWKPFAASLFKQR